MQASSTSALATSRRQWIKSSETANQASCLRRSQCFAGGAKDNGNRTVINTVWTRSSIRTGVCVSRMWMRTGESSYRQIRVGPTNPAESSLVCSINRDRWRVLYLHFSCLNRRIFQVRRLYGRSPLHCAGRSQVLAHATCLIAIASVTPWLMLF